MTVEDLDTFQEGMLKMFRSLSKHNPEFVDDFIAGCSVEQRLRGISLEDRLRSLLPPEDRLRARTLEEIVDLLSPEVRERLKQGLRELS